MERAQPGIPTSKPTIGVLLIATGKYDQFVKPFIESSEKFFLPEYKKIYILFSDKITNPPQLSDAFKDIPNAVIVKEHMEHRPWPNSTLKRYETFTRVSQFHVVPDYLFYSDVDMRFVAPVGEEVLSEGLTATLHPGFYSFPGQGSWGNNIESLSYTPMEFRKKYYAGGFQGGKASEYLKVCEHLAQNINYDLSKGIIAEWHDEAHWNCFLSTYKGPLTQLTPSYCMVEETHKRINWKIDHLEPKLIALAKNHEELRK